MPENTPERLRRLGENWRRSRDALNADREALQAALYDAEQAGTGVREIARHSGVPFSTVARFLGVETARLQNLPALLDSTEDR